MYRKSIEMSFDQAVRIVNDLLDVFQYICEKHKSLNLNIVDVQNMDVIYTPEFVYKVTHNNRSFEMTLFDDPDDLGYCSILPDYNPSTYVLCEIVEKRSNGQRKYEFTFGFNIEKGTFLELFEVLHFNTVGILREYPNLNSELEALLKDVVLI